MIDFLTFMMDALDAFFVLFYCLFYKHINWDKSQKVMSFLVNVTPYTMIRSIAWYQYQFICPYRFGI